VRGDVRLVSFKTAGIADAEIAPPATDANVRALVAKSRLADRSLQSPPFVATLSRSFNSLLIAMLGAGALAVLSTIDPPSSSAATMRGDRLVLTSTEDVGTVLGHGFASALMTLRVSAATTLRTETAASVVPAQGASISLSARSEVPPMVQIAPAAIEIATATAHVEPATEPTVVRAALVTSIPAWTTSIAPAAVAAVTGDNRTSAAPSRNSAPTVAPTVSTSGSAGDARKQKSTSPSAKTRSTQKQVVPPPTALGGPQTRPATATRPRAAQASWSSSAFETTR
jgi:hypothetical protein